MDRRSFLRGLGALVGGLAIEQAIPLGRVWSFPKDIKVNKGLDGLSGVLWDGNIYSTYGGLPRMAFLKPRQIGMTTWSINMMLHKSGNYVVMGGDLGRTS